MIDRYRRSYVVDLADGVLAPRPAFSLGADIPLAGRTQVQSRHAGGLRLTLGQYEPLAADVAASLPEIGRASLARRHPFMALEAQIAPRLRFRMARNLALAAITDDPADPVRNALLTRAGWRGPLGQPLAETTAVTITRSWGRRWSLGLGAELGRSARVYAPGGDAAPTGRPVRRQRVQIQMGYAGRTLALGLGLAHVRESGLAFDARGSGALALGDGRHLLLHLTGRWRLADRWSLFASFDGLRTRLVGADNPLLVGVAPLIATAYGGGLTRDDLLAKGDRLRLSVLMPLAVVHGRVRLRLPTGRDYLADRFLFETRALSLTPGARERDLILGYSLPLGRGLRLETALRGIRHAGHVAARGWGMEGALRLGLRF